MALFELYLQEIRNETKRTPIALFGVRRFVRVHICITLPFAITLLRPRFGDHLKTVQEQASRSSRMRRFDVSLFSWYDSRRCEKFNFIYSEGSLDLHVCVSPLLWSWLLLKSRCASKVVLRQLSEFCFFAWFGRRRSFEPAQISGRWSSELTLARSGSLRECA